MFIIKYKKIFFALSAILFIASFFMIGFFGLNFGIDFKGGALLEVSYPEGRPDTTAIEEKLKELALGETLIQQAGEKNVIVRTKDLSEGIVPRFWTRFRLAERHALKNSGLIPSAPLSAVN